MNECILALDFGGTKLSAAVAAVTELEQDSPHWLARERVFSPEDGAAQFDIETMIALGKQLLSGERPFAVGVSFGGPVDYHAGIVRLSHHVPGWENIPLRDMLTEEFAAPVQVDNDANVAALGEWRFGAGRGVDSLFYVTVSTGVGGGWVLNGRCWRGHAGMAGEIGHTVVEPNGPVCLCGKRGCVERLASGPYMAQDFMALHPDMEVTGKELAELAVNGHVDAERILLRGAKALGVGIGNAANLLNPQQFILGGGVTKSGEKWWQTVRQAAQETALPEVHFEVVPAAFADDAPLWGAVALAIGD
ncbi:MAG: sugar kinase [Chloroflexi bacterium]|nr:MAG: sugar kinase [Chloroflexota bacterium]